MSRPVISISASVGKDGVNVNMDVRAVQALLNRAGANPRLTEHGIPTDETIEAIVKFQKRFLKEPDGRVDPGGPTLRRLNEYAVQRRILVSLARQKLFASAWGKEVFEFDCTTGDAANKTPPGLFRVYRKERFYVSRAYNVPMDFAMFFNRGIAIHKSQGVAFTAAMKRMGFHDFGSHGCVRLEEADARKLFDWTPIGTPVEVIAE